MIRLQWMLVALVAGAALSATLPADRAEATSAAAFESTCPVTIPNGEGPSPANYGNGELWVTLAYRNDRCPLVRRAVG
ncbi:MAG TPA: hypothetical protein VF877_04370 [Gaiellaceae bacterium]